MFQIKNILRPFFWYVYIFFSVMGVTLITFHSVISFWTHFVHQIFNLTESPHIYLIAICWYKFFKIRFILFYFPPNIFAYRLNCSITTAMCCVQINIKKRGNLVIFNFNYSCKRMHKEDMIVTISIKLPCDHCPILKWDEK